MSHSQFMLPKQSTITTEHRYYRAPLLQSTVTEQLILNSCCQSRVPLLTSLNSECLLLTVQEAGKTKIKVPADEMSGEDILLDLQTDIFSFYPHMAENWE